MTENPFRKGSQRNKLFDIMSDLEWHCASCELPGSQPAATIRDLRRKGYDIETASIKFGKKAKMCENCGQLRTHYRLTDIKPIHSPKERSSLPDWLVDRVLKIYDQREAIFNRKKHPKELTVDHRIPNIRWKKSEAKFEKSISDQEVIEKFQLLTNEDNLLKSRNCEKCFETDIRQPFLEINFFYKGTKEFKDQIGCQGCGWFDPNKWKKSLNKLLGKLKVNI